MSRTLQFLWSLYGGIVVRILAFPVWAWQRWQWSQRQRAVHTRAAEEMESRVREVARQRIRESAARQGELHMALVSHYLTHNHPMPLGWKMEVSIQRNMPRGEVEIMLLACKGDRRHAVKASPLCVDLEFDRIANPEAMASYLNPYMASLVQHLKRQDEIERLKEPT